MDHRCCDEDYANNSKSLINYGGCMAARTVCTLSVVSKHNIILIHYNNCTMV